MTKASRPRPIKAVLFDWGGVMSGGGRGGELGRRLARNLHVPGTRGDDLIALVWNDFSTGKIDEDTAWRRIADSYGQPIGLATRKIWNTWRHTGAVPEMKTLITELRQTGYKVGLISNVIPPTAEEIRKHDGYDLFDFIILSYEVGVSKPDKKIYELAMEKLPGIKPDEVVFIDDQPACLPPAEEMGMHTILAKSPAQIKNDLEKLLKVSHP